MIDHEELIARARDAAQEHHGFAYEAELFVALADALTASEQARRAAESAAAEMRTRHEKRRERLRVEIDAVVPPYPTMGMGGGSVAEEAAQKEWEAKHAHFVPLLNAIDESNVLEPLAEDTEGMHAKIIEGLRTLASDRAARLCAQDTKEESSDG